MKTPIGIDISYKKLDHHRFDILGHAIKGSLNNTVADIRHFLASHCPDQHFLVVEPTGTYGDKLVNLAHQLGFEIRLASPRRSSSYMDALGQLNKTDANAALALCLMGGSKEFELPLYTPPDRVLQQRRQVQLTLGSLSKQAAMLRNRIHAMEQRLSPSEVALTALRTALGTIEEQMALLERELLQLTDEQTEEFMHYASSVTGIGEKSSSLLLLYTNGLRYFDKKSQLSRFVGVVPPSHRSGTSVNRTGGITKAGPSVLRACLYNAAKSAKRFNHACKALYERLRRNGKPHKLAMIAVINKLLHQVFAVVKSKTLFDNEHYLKNQME